MRNVSAIVSSIFLGLAAVLNAGAGTTQAQTYPSKPVRLLVGFAPAGPNDIVARALAQKLAEQTGQQFIIENRAGANTAIASELLVRSPPDGYTLMFVSLGHATNPALMKLSFDPIRDFAFITQVADAQNVALVHPSLPIRSLNELTAFAKQRPGQINFGSAGTGASGHLAGELFQIMTGTKLVHIPYKGAGPALIDLLAGQHVLYFTNIAGVISYIRSNRLRAIAITGEKRSPALPDVPTSAESGLPGFVVSAWYGVAAPAKTPRAAVDKINGEVLRALKAPDLRTRLLDLGTEPVGSTPEHYTTFMQNEIAKWAKVIKAAGIKGE